MAILTARPLQRTAVINVVGLTSRHLGPSTPFIAEFQKKRRHRTAPIEPVLPAVTSTMQATYVTGLPPGRHGIVANGWYDRQYAEHFFWKQSDHLVAGKKLWDSLREVDPGFTCAKLFWWNNMYSSVDYSITPRPIYRADGDKVFDIYTHPMDARPRIKKELGDFPFPSFWGPGSGLPSSQWIALSAKWIEEKYFPSLSLVYLPHLDYNFQRLGPNDPAIETDLQEIDAIVGELIRFYSEKGVKVVLLSEYGITQVDQPIHLNRIFREKGWITIKDELNTDILDLGASRAFAIADHQVAHVYVNDPEILTAVRDTLRETEGVGDVLDAPMISFQGLEHARAGDLIAVADERSWFTYYYWEKDKRAPDFARCVDIHRKPGYDPVELFLNPKILKPKATLGRKLIRKKLGFRTLFDVVPLDATLVKGSHGRVPEDSQDWPLIMGELPNLPQSRALNAVEVFGHLFDHCSSGHGYELTF